LAEVTWNHRDRVEKAVRVRRGESDYWEENLERNIRRARTVLTRKIIYGKLDHLLTLTYRENVENLLSSLVDLSKFLDRVQAEIPGWRYVVVWERQKRGAIHFHLAVQGWQKVNLLRIIWRSIVGEGNIDVKPPRKMSGNSVWDRVRLSRYLGKYLTKMAGEDYRLNKKTYWHSRDVENPPVSHIVIEWADPMEWALELVRPISGRRLNGWTDQDGLIGRVANF
jgi:hypothetical protein